MRSGGAASSPGHNPRREEAVNSGRRDEQMVPYDPIRAGKGKAVQVDKDWHSTSRGVAGRGNRDQGNAGHRNAATAMPDSVIPWEQGKIYLRRSNSAHLGKREVQDKQHNNKMLVRIRKDTMMVIRP